MAIRVIVTDMPPMLRAIVMKILTGEPDLELHEVNGDEDVLVTEVRTHRPHVLVTTGGGSSELSQSVMFAHPQMKVLTIDGDGREANLYQLRPERLMLGEVSADGLVAAIRGSASGSPAQGEGRSRWGV